MNGYLKIILKSDLCVGSGYSYAGTIDTDTTYDQYGLPYIPARRLKGCLREAAEQINIKELDDIFGTRGKNHLGSLRIGNAVLSNCKELTEAIKKGLIQNEFERNEVLDLFTSVRAQTRIDQEIGVAKDNSLRYTRVVNHYSPLDDKELCFKAPVHFDGDITLIQKMAKALRSLGMNRNRGLGSVICEFIIEDGATKEKNKHTGKVLTLVIKNDEALILSGLNNTKSEKVINGQMIAGAAAYLYLKKYGKESVDEEMFQDLFLNGKVKFTDACPAIKKDDKWIRCIPAPNYLQKLKKEKKLVNKLGKKLEMKNTPYDESNGNIPKLLKGMFVGWEEKDQIIKYFLKEEDMEIDYHHSKMQESSDGTKGILYTNEVVRSGQYFMCSIVSDDEKDIEELSTLFDNQDLYFGKSKSAQYGLCHVVDITKQDYFSEIKTFSNEIVVTLASDSIFVSGYPENAHETIMFLETAKEVAKDLGIDPSSLIEDKCFCETSERVGYYTKWNMKKQAVPVIKAGSSYVFQLSEDKKLPVHTWVGERNHQGFGEVFIQSVSEMEYQASTLDIQENEKTLELNEKMQNLYDQLHNKIYETKLMDHLIYTYLSKNNNRLRINGSKLGRITLMLKESMDQYTGDTEAIFKEYYTRLASMKDKETRQIIMKFIQNVENINDEKVKQNEKLFKKIQPEYILNVLVLEKYRLGSDA